MLKGQLEFPDQNSEGREGGERQFKGWEPLSSQFWESDVKIEKPLTNQVPGLYCKSQTMFFPLVFLAQVQAINPRGKKQSSVIYNATQH